MGARLVLATAILCILSACAGTKGKHSSDPVYYTATPTFLWSDVSNLNSGCCAPETSGTVFAIIGYPEIDFHVTQPGHLRIELLCQDSSLIGALFDSTIVAVGWSRVYWSGHDKSGMGGPGCAFLCRVILPDSMSEFAYRPQDNYPNPFSAGTDVSFALADSGKVSIVFYDVTGDTVRHLIDSVEYPPGRHQRAWDGLGDSSQALPSGIYFYRLFVNDSLLATKKMILLK